MKISCHEYFDRKNEISFCNVSKNMHTKSILLNNENMCNKISHNMSEI